ncbi:MAG: hypothetical protein QXY54_04655 [Nitrososphaerota archaeon]
MKNEIFEAQKQVYLESVLYKDKVTYVAALTAFVAQTLHMFEHSVQMYQHVVLGLPTKLSNGLLFFLDLEWNHFFFNTIYLLLLSIVLARMRVWESLGWHDSKLLPTLFLGGFLIQSYHVVEHTARLYEFLTTGCTPCTGIIGGFFNMVHLHFFLNLAAYLPLTLLLVKSGALSRLLIVHDWSESDKQGWLKYFESPATTLVPLFAYGFFTGYSIDVDIFGVTLFTAVGLSFFASVFEGRFAENFMEAVAFSILAVMSFNMSYFSAISLVFLSFFASRMFRMDLRPKLNHLALSMALILLISSPSLAASRWGTYNLYTFFTVLLLLGIARAALSKSLDVVLIYIFSWIVIFIPAQLSLLETTLSEALLLFPSAALKMLTNPLFGLLAFFIVPYPSTFPENRLRYLYPLLCSGLAYLVSQSLPIDLAAYIGVALSNIAFIIYANYKRLPGDM